MQSSSRRAFLMGRRSAQNPWDVFCQRVRRSVAGTLFDFGIQDGVGSARLTPKQAADVQHARALCTEYGVVLALDGIQHAEKLDGHPVLWVDPGRDMAGCQRLSNDSSKWFIQPGCLLGELEAQGLRQFADLPCHLTVAAWLADRTLCDWDSGETVKSGLAHVSVLLADGTSANLGPFGEHNQQPLGSLSLQKMIPALFQLAGQDSAKIARQQTRWPARYRLDALLPAEGASVNLSHLVLGHGGDLGWVEWIVLDEQALQEPSTQAQQLEQADSQAASRPVFSMHVDAMDQGMGLLATELDAQVKALFDPLGLFPHPGQDLMQAPRRSFTQDWGQDP